MRALGGFLVPPLYKPYPPFLFPSSISSSIHLSRNKVPPIMAQPQPESHTTNGSNEPSPKIPKLHQNDDVSTNPPFLRVKKLSDKAVLPSRASPLSAGYDLSSAVETKVPARGKALVATDISISIPEGTYARIAPRSGLAWKHSIDVGAGVIDADYRGPVGVILFNHSDVDFEVKVGDSVAQLIIEKIWTLDVAEVEDLDCANPPLLRVKKLSDKAVLPSRASPLSAGYDLSSAVETKVPARGKALVATDISISIPEGTYPRVAPRSGLAWKHSIDLGAGVIDADYRGPVVVILFNNSDVDFEVKVGDRVAQLIIQEIVVPPFLQNDDNSANPPFPCVKELADEALLRSGASPLSAGYDLSSAVETKVPGRGMALVATDISISIPEGTYAHVEPRSELAWKPSISVGAGLIDADYQGPIRVVLFNHSDVDFELKIGDRIAQLIIKKIVTPNVVGVEDLDSTVRGEGGFGSSGV